MKKIKILLIALMSAGSFAQAAPQICKGKDRKNGIIYHLQVEEMALPKGSRIQVNTSKNGFHYYTSGLYHVSDYFVTGMGTYIKLDFISGNVNLAYQFLIGVGKIFLLTKRGSVQLFCE